MAFNTPIAFFVFNRPKPTQVVFEVIRSMQPTELLLIADGPRGTRQGEAALCNEVRAIVQRVDWPCTVRTNFSEENLGCKRRLSSGLTWVFQQVEEAIILEDDCVANKSFFEYCRECLEKYRNDTRIGVIGGNNFMPNGFTRSDASYYFSRHSHIWGWASWRRAFENYDVEMKEWPALREQGWLEDLFQDDHALVSYWKGLFDKVYKGEIDTWDYQLLFSQWRANRVSICPRKNLVTNIGFGADATHTHDDSPWATMPTSELEFPLKHPKVVSVDKLADDFVCTMHFNVPWFKPSERSQKLYNYTPKVPFADPKGDRGSVYTGAVNSAVQALQTGDSMLALQLLSPCLQSGTAFLEVNYLAGVASMVLGDGHAACRYFETELQINPNHQDSRQFLAQLRP